MAPFSVGSLDSFARDQMQQQIFTTVRRFLTDRELPILTLSILSVLSRLGMLSQSNCVVVGWLRREWTGHRIIATMPAQKK